MFYPVAGKMIPWFAIPAAILFAAGMYVGFFIAPTDFQQGDAYRIIFIHVPAAWMGMFLYVLMAIYAGVGWAFNARLASMMASALAVTGAMRLLGMATSVPSTSRLVCRAASAMTAYTSAQRSCVS